MRIGTRRIPAFVLAAILGLGLPGSAQSESLKDALASAYRTNHLLEQQRALLRAKSEDVAKAVASMRPVINVVGQMQRTVLDFDGGLPSSVTTTAALSATLDLLLFDFGQSPLRVKAAEEAVLATREALRGVENQVLFEAAAAYLDLYRDVQALEVSRNNVRVIAEELRAARDRFEVGEVTRTDVAQAEARLAAARSALAAAEGRLAVSRAAYQRAVGHPAGKVSAPRALPRMPRSLEEARAIARDRNPQILALQHAVKAAEHNLARARAARRPVLALSGALGRDFDGDYASSRIGVALTMPIYQGGALPAGERQALANLEAARAELNYNTVAVIERVTNGWSNLLLARAQREASARQVEAARLAFEGTREEARLGSRTTLDVLDAEQELLTARTNLITAEAGAIKAAYGLLAAMGVLDARTLGLPVEVYDPVAYHEAVRRAPFFSDRAKRLDRVLKRAGKE